MLLIAWPSSRATDNTTILLHAAAAFDWGIVLVTIILSIGDFSIRTFLETCLRENERRLGLYDPSLLRPRFAPRLARTALRFMRS